MNILLRILANALGLIIITKIVSGITVDNFYVAVITAIVLGIVNAVVKPVLWLLTLPISLLTLGLFSFVINASLFFFVASFIEGFSVVNFWYALIGSILMSIVSAISAKVFS
jgi:putative membrane protein